MVRKQISIIVGIAAGIILGLIFLIAGFLKLPVQTDAYTILLSYGKSRFCSG